MAIGSPSLQPVKSLYNRFFKDTGGESFLKARFLPYILPFLLGIAVALYAASLVIDRNWLFLVALVCSFPVAIIFLRYPFFAVLVWLVVFPFFVRETIPGSRYVYWILHRAMIPGAFGIAFLAELLGKEKKRLLRFGVAEVAMLLYLLLSIINIMLLNQTPVDALIRYYDRIFVPFCMYGLVRLTAPTSEDLKRIAWIAPLIVITQSTIGLAAWFAPGKLPAMWLNRVGERTVGTFGYPGVFTTTLVFCSLFLFQYAIQSKSFWVRLACFSLFALSLVSIFFSFSRGSWLGLMMVFLGLLYFYPRVTFNFGMALLTLFLFIGLTYFSNYITFGWQRLTAQDSAEGRIIGGAATLRVIESSPLFGVGYENHENYDEQYRGRVLGFAANRSTSSHNTYLLLAAEMGLVGLLLYMLPMVWLWFVSRRAWAYMPQDGFSGQKMLALMWLFLLDYMLVSAFTDMIQGTLFSTTLWWFTLGLIASLTTPYLPSTANKHRRATSRGKVVELGPAQK